MNLIAEKIAKELSVRIEQVTATIKLLDEGATVPFIARYRKEVTGSLDDTQLRTLSERLIYLKECAARRETILNSIREQNKLTAELERALHATDDKAVLEDLYAPYKPKRRTKAQIAKEQGLEALALALISNDFTEEPLHAAAHYINAEHGINTAEEALEGARHIVIELLTEKAELIGQLREYVWTHAILHSKLAPNQEDKAAKFADYYTYQETIKTIPSHRALALLRGQREQILWLNLCLTDDEHVHCRQRIQSSFALQNTQAAIAAWIEETIRQAWRFKLFIKLELELMQQLREQAETVAIQVFANNLKNLLMLAPAGARVTMGLDPGYRTGVKVVIIDTTGSLLFYTTLFPHAPQNQWQGAIHTLAQLCQQYKVELISIGNGTASRETDKLITELKQAHTTLNITSVVVSEAGASVYSASEYAAQEFPELDVTYRGAVSIARRLQDPLAELVKIDPKSIGVGQYQHDVSQTKLSRSLHAVMEDCVSAVGVDVNTASIPLLSTVAGLNQLVAKNIVLYREQHGLFKNRQQLIKVPQLGTKAFEQAAGFLRIHHGDNCLDTSAVHPEAYPVVERILAKQNKSIQEMIGNSNLLRTLKASDYADEYFGVPTVSDIFMELEKPGRDPRPTFKTASFKEGIETLNDLKPGLILEGVVTNVAHFGAFVDIGVHQDGLVHISMLADRFVRDASDIVKVGDIVKVKVLEVDVHRKRISLSMRLDAEATSTTPERKATRPQRSKQETTKNESPFGSHLRDALMGIQTK